MDKTNNHKIENVQLIFGLQGLQAVDEELDYVGGVLNFIYVNAEKLDHVVDGLFIFDLGIKLGSLQEQLLPLKCNRNLGNKNFRNANYDVV